MNRYTTSDALPEPEALGFGRYLGHSIVHATHTAEGWSAPEVLPRHAVQLDLATGALQYGLSVFEGLKAFRAADGSLHLFRPLDHIKRLQRSAERLGLPEMPQEFILEMALQSVRAHAGWVPPHQRGSLYLRPTLYACEEMLGLRASQRHALTVIATPSSNPAGQPLRLWAEPEMIRAAPGGLGEAKTGANYAASRIGAQRAQARGYDDVLWLDAREHRWLGEAGTMNVFVVLADRVLTPPLDGTILAGITRDSVLRLLRDSGMRAEETPIGLEQLASLAARGEVREIFGVGTAARVAPIREIGWQDGSILPTGGLLSMQLSQQLAELQDGIAPDPLGWRVSV